MHAWLHFITVTTLPRNYVNICVPKPKLDIMPACSACIHELVEGGQSGGVPCPLCRSQLHSGDLYDAVTEEEAAEARQAASIQGDYGSKVTLTSVQATVVCITITLGF